MRKRAKEKQRQEINELILKAVLKFVDRMPADIDRLIEELLKDVTIFLHADRAYVYQFDRDRKKLMLSHLYSRAGVKEKIAQHDQVDSVDFSVLIKPLVQGENVMIESLKDIPLKSTTIRAIMEVEGSKSMFLYPLSFDSRPLGILGLDMVEKTANFNFNINYLMGLGGRIVVRALQRKKSVFAEILRERKLNYLFSDIQDVVFISSPAGKLIEVNPAAVRLFGYDSVEELYQLDIDKDFYFDPAERKKYKKAIQSRGQVKDYELILKKKDGQRIVVLETSAAIRDEQDQIIAYGGILRDVTEKRQLEQQIFQAQKMESIGLMAGGVAHDFNNILTTINGYAELIKMDMNKNDPHYKDIKNILEGGKRAENLIRQLLAFSRRQMIQPKIIDINKVIRELHKMLSRLIAEDISIEIKLKEQIKSIKADPSQIQQILVNLVINADYAIKEQPDKTQPKMIRILTDEERLNRADQKMYPGSREGYYVRISVEDSGIGIDKKIKEKIFEPFFSTKRKGEGSGLGLSTVYGIVKQNHGFIYVDSEPGIGSTFKIYWPVSAEVIDEEKKDESKVSLKTRSELVLFVEDDFHVRALAVEGLSAMGYKVIEAENGRRALEIIRKKSLIDKLDLVITDIIMPEMGGEELANHLRQMNPDLPILLCSGYTDSRIENKDSLVAKSFHFLGKPFTIEKMDKKIQTMLAEHKT